MKVALIKDNNTGEIHFYDADSEKIPIRRKVVGDYSIDIENLGNASIQINPKYLFAVLENGKIVNAGGLEAVMGKIVGYVEGVEFDKPKKTVVKEAGESLPFYMEGVSYQMKNFFIPRNAKNIKCIYEIEE